MIAYHFVGKTLRDGRPVPKNGVWLKHKGACVMCQSGLHASKHPFDALQYAQGGILCKVEVRKVVATQDDKLVCRERKIVARFDATELMRAFARKCALDVIHLWDAPPVVREYLETGNESLRDAARIAAGAATGAAAGATAWAATWAARDTAGAAATAASGAASWAAVEASQAKQRKSFAAMVRKEFRKA